MAHNNYVCAVLSPPIYTVDLLSITDMTTTQGPAIHQRYKLYVAQEPSYVLLAFGHF